MRLGPDPSGGNRTKSRLVRGTIAAAGALARVAVTSGPASADSNVVADGVISPLDFAVGYNGTVYVAEAFIGQITAFPKHGGRKVLVPGVEGQGSAAWTSRSRCPTREPFRPRCRTDRPPTRR